ncbi:fungal-specific transcription factor domain-containing protein [Podospora didyma]|uniref:Fungal-specific transcription factor domain-containing protein n=1 Tax=Podospora didyma TaxID=330526 RepID=A0AAE0P4L7_9PEZI|nr:fungal-specific transcription factor domain-containing protein [Podospora didyma]
MATKTRSSDGCWTCRLRRKKCDEVRPLCNACGALEIDCLYSDDKPDWMDGAEKQKEKADQLKLEVKQRASHRRERRYLQGLEMGLEALEVSHADLQADMQADGSQSPDERQASHISPGPSHALPMGTESSPSSFSRPQDSGSEFSGTQADTGPSSSADTTARDDHHLMSDFEEFDLTMIMTYLDYVFPFLFPFYQPPLLDAGRGWLLSMLRRNKAILHTALSLASYFFNVVLSHATQSHQDCRAHNWDNLQRQQDLAVHALQREMNDIVARGVKNYLSETNQVMASVIQLLTFEVAIANTGNWIMHLDAATELYTEMVKHHGIADGDKFCFAMMLTQLGHKPWEMTPMNHPWSSDQASLRFFTAFLLFYDTLASTALDRPPRLKYLHKPLLADISEEEKRSLPAGEREYALPHIDMHHFLGLQNWVVMCLGEIAALDAWKKEMKKNGSLSMTVLVARAAAIERCLRVRLLALEAPQVQPECNDLANCSNPTHDHDPLIQFGLSGRLQSPLMLKATASISRVWAQAALTYLSVVVSGWQPASPETRHSVALTMQLFSSFPDLTYLRALVWPFTVTGCLAGPELEQTFRDMVAAMGPLQLFGTIREALAIMEHVWANRAQIDSNADSWDLAACFRCLGRPALLV